MTNTGLAHGGNGFEAVEYLLEQFAHTGLQDPGTRDETVDLKGLANQAAKQYFKYKQAQREAENPAYKRIPCINHPVFKGKDVNIDPREDFVRKELENRGSFNAFLEFYHHLVRELFNEGATENVFCVNVDAVLACVALKLIWADLRGKRMTVHQAKDLVFILFLLGRAIGVAAEIADHRDRGEDMDCRTPQNEVSFVL
jgi:citrate synthase